MRADGRRQQSMSARKKVTLTSKRDWTLQISENELQENILDIAKTFGWRRAHFRPARTKYGWRTPVQADGKGFPDLVLVKPPRLVIAEVKRQKTDPNEYQREWLNDFAGVPCVEVYTWKPSDWEDIVSVLSSKGLLVRDSLRMVAKK